MPTYEYSCDSCGHTMDLFQKITADPEKECPECRHHTLRRGPGGGAGLIFQGSGFYITDYCQNKENKESQEKSSPSKKDSCPCGKDKPS